MLKLSKFCSTCQKVWDIPNGLLTRMSARTIEIVESYGYFQIDISAADGCKFCIFLRQVRHLVQDPRWDPDDRTQLRICWFDNDLFIEGSPYFLHQVVSSKIPDRHQVSFDRIRSWLQVCDEECHLPKPGASCIDRLRALNGWFINVDKRCISKLPDIKEYAALSYVWGGVEQPVLDSKNIEKLQQPGALDKTFACSQTIKDAMHICRKIGVQYLWADALCIQQDSLYRRTHIQNMDVIYICASFTIVAADSQNANHGIHGISLKRNQLPHFEHGSQSAVLSSDTVYEWLLSSEWGKRGWTYQEAIFSRRLLVFAECFSYLICPLTVKREDCYERDLGTRNTDYREFKYLELPDFSSPLQNTNLYESYVKGYVTRTLTKEEDMLNAFNGIMTFLQPLYGEFWYGLPQQQFLKALSWSCLAPLKRRNKFPSWSWAGWIYPRKASLNFLDADGHEPTVMFYRLNDFKQLVPYQIVPSKLCLDRTTLSESDLWVIMREFKMIKSPLETLLVFETTVLRLTIRRDSQEDTTKEAEYEILNNEYRGRALIDSNWEKGQEVGKEIEVDFAIMGSRSFSMSILTLVLDWDGSVAYRIGVAKLWEERYHDIGKKAAKKAYHKTIILG